MTEEGSPEHERYLKPAVIVIWVAFLVGGVVAGIFFYFPHDWGLARRIAAGLVSGAFAALILTANRLIGSSEVI